MTADTVPLDRRQRRRQETIEEVLDIAVEIMTEQGVAGLSIGEVARRMGIRPPSLYGYFPSKEAIYDAVFFRGARKILEHMRPHVTVDDSDERSLEDRLIAAGRAMTSWSVTNPAYTQMIFWRPVPGFVPSEHAYQPAVELMDLGVDHFRALQQRGLFSDDVAIDDAIRDWTILLSGVTSQQMSNAPEQSFAEGVFTTRLPTLVAMYCAHYGAKASSTTTRGTRNARKR